MEVSISSLASEEMCNCVRQFLSEDLCYRKRHYHVILSMPDIHLGSERSESMIVLWSYEVSLRDTGSKEVNTLDEEEIDRIITFYLWIAMVFLDLSEILEEKTSTK
jgi:hypothetical protein